MNDRRTIKGVAYATTLSLLQDAGPTGATADDIVVDPDFDGYADPHSAVRRAFATLVSEGVAEEMPHARYEGRRYRMVVTA